MARIVKVKGVSIRLQIMLNKDLPLRMSGARKEKELMSNIACFQL
jgi:hypothetical protein